MAPTYLINSLLDLGEKMRQAQKAYFAEKDPLAKRQFLALSKRYEKDFDTLIINTKQITETWQKQK